MQCVLKADNRIVSRTRKLDRGLSRLLCDDLHWLDVSERERVQFKLGVTVYRCLHHITPQYLVDMQHTGL